MNLFFVISFFKLNVAYVWNMNLKTKKLYYPISFVLLLLFIMKIWWFAGAECQTQRIFTRILTQERKKNQWRIEREWDIWYTNNCAEAKSTPSPSPCEDTIVFKSCAPENNPGNCSVFTLYLFSIHNKNITIRRTDCYSKKNIYIYILKIWSFGILLQWRTHQLPEYSKAPKF